MNGAEDVVVATKNLMKHYDHGLIRALDGVTLQARRGEIVAVVGPSGCGKTTLLSLIGALESPTSGEVWIQGRPLAEHRPLHRLRARTLGFVFQLHNLIPAMTLLENVEAATYPLRIPRAVGRARALALLGDLGLSHRAHARPAQLSGGERQRAAIARALVNDPALVLADEPTGNVDSRAGRQILDLLVEGCRARAATVLMATHNLEVADAADRVVHMRDGLVEKTTQKK
jgi:ABC-type lipoprotein export system ATPase subunit